MGALVGLQAILQSMNLSARRSVTLNDTNKVADIKVKLASAAKGF